MGNTNINYFRKKMSSEIVSLIGSFIDIDTVVTLSSMVDCSFLVELTQMIEYVKIETEKVKDSAFILNYLLRLVKISIDGNFNLDGLNILHQIKELNISNVNQPLCLSKLNNLNHLYLKKCSISDDVIINNSKFNNLTYLSLINCDELTKDLYSYIRNFTKLTYLTIKSSAMDEMNDTVISNLSTLTNLEHLNLYCTCITDASIADISTFYPNLTKLNVSLCRITNNCLDSISKITKLSKLNLRARYAEEPFLLNNLSIKKIINLQNITSLKLQNTLINDESVKIISESFINLVKLNINHTKITDISLEYLVNVKLEVLNIGSNFNIDNKSLKIIEKMHNIRKLHLGDCAKITYNGLYLLSSLTQLIHLVIDRSIISLDVQYNDNVKIKNNDVSELMNYCKYLIRLNEQNIKRQKV